MCKNTVTESQRLLLNVITEVESGEITPETAVEQLTAIKELAPEGFKAEYTLADFQRIQAASNSTYQSSTTEPEYESSYQSSY